MQHTTNYRNAFISVSPDTTARAGIIPGKAGSVADLQYRMISAAPYMHTSDDVIFTVHADRAGLSEGERPAARAVYFSKGQACLRASPLVKSFGWGVHHDADGRVALHGLETRGYADLAEDPDLDVIPGMRASRKTG